MSFQAYLDNIKLKTGKSPEEFKILAEEKGLLLPGVKASEIVSWLKKDFGLGHGHSMAIYTYFKGHKLNMTLLLEKHFNGTKKHWRPTYERIISKLKSAGENITVNPSESYLSLLKNGKKFAIIKITSERMDIGLKLKGVQPKGRLETSGKWNNLVTHRVKITEAQQIDNEVFNWFKKAHSAV